MADLKTLAGKLELAIFEFRLDAAQYGGYGGSTRQIRLDVDLAEEIRDALQETAQRAERRELVRRQAFGFEAGGPGPA